MQQGVTEFHKITGTVQINFTLSVLSVLGVGGPSKNSFPQPRLRIHVNKSLALSPLKNYLLPHVTV